MTDRVLFLWPYYHAAARYDELRWSMRSVAAHYQGNADLLVVGDRPPWYSGEMIEMRRNTTGTHFLAGLRDALIKFSAAMENVSHNTIVWMMDDTFFMDKFSLHDLLIKRADSPIGRPSGGGFARAKAQTKARLEREKFSTWDFATHLPHVVHRELCLDLFEYYDIVEQLHLWEIIYGNVTLNGTPEPTHPFFQYITGSTSDAQIATISKRSTVFNVQDNQWNEPIRRWLYDNLPDRPEFENSDPVPPIRSKTVSRAKGP